MKIERTGRQSRWLFVLGLTGCLLGCSSEGPTVTTTKEERAQNREAIRSVRQEVKAERKGGVKKKSTPTAPPETTPAAEPAKAGGEAPEK